MSNVENSSSGMGTKLAVIGGVLAVIVVGGVIVGVPSYAKSVFYKGCKDSVANLNHSIITSGISVDVKKDESAGSLFSDKYLYEVYSGSNKIAVFNQNNSYGLTSVSAEIAVVPESIEDTDSGLKEYLKNLKVVNEYNVLAGQGTSVFEFPAYSGKLGDLNAKWDAGRIVSEIHGDSFGPVTEVKFGTFTAENEDMSFIVKDINATRNKFNLGSIKFVEKVHDVDDKDTPVDEAADNTQNNEEAVAKNESTGSEEKNNEIVLENLSFAVNPEFVDRTTLNNAMNLSLDKFIFDFDELSYSIKDFKLDLQVKNMQFKDVMDKCGLSNIERDIQKVPDCVTSLKYKLNQEEQTKVGLSLIAGASFEFDAKYVMNKGAMVHQLKMNFPEDTKNPMSLMTGTKIDAHLESNKAAVDSIVDLVPEFASVRSLLVKYDKNNHVDKYVTNFVCDGLMMCKVNGTPLR